MQEIELRLQIPPAQYKAVRHWLDAAGPDPVRSERLQAAYFDTPARDLARAGFALRLRREGRRWVQTLKGEAPDGMSRLEHNVDLGSSAAMPALDVSRHGGHPAGDALLERVRRLGGEAALQCLFRTDIRRRSRLLCTPQPAASRQAPQGGQANSGAALRLLECLGGSVLELALDEGLLLAGSAAQQREAPVCELEIELKSGDPGAVLALARECVARHGLWLEQRSKALRGDLLARGQLHAPPACASAHPWERRAGPQSALTQQLQAALGPVLGNASQIASGAHAPEHLHQLRVGLRRLRVGLRLLQALPATEAWPLEPLRALQNLATALGRALSAGRDADAQADAPWQARLEAAYRASGLPPPPPTMPAAAAGTGRPAEVLRGLEAQTLMLDVLDLLSRMSGAAPSRPKLLRQACAATLTRWQRQLLRSGKAALLQDASSRHQLRKHIKRLRYGLELTALLQRKPAPPALIDGLRDLQQQLGDLNDLALALEQATAGPDPAWAAFALGFLLQEQAQRLRQAHKRWRRWCRLAQSH